MSGKKKDQPTWPPGAWTPVRRGKIFCSPACGADCTYEAYQKAKHDAQLVAQLLGPKWKPVVSENCKWFWSVQLDSGLGLVMSISPTEHKGRITFSAMMGSIAGSGDYAFHSTRHFRNPLQAARLQMKLLREYVHRRDAQLAAFETAMKRR